MSKYHGSYIWQVYKYARTGLSDNKLAEVLGIMRPTFRSWRGKHKAFAEAIQQGRIDAGTGTIRDYIYEHLSPEIRETWDKITAFEEMENGEDRITELLSNHGKPTRQRLFLHAASVNNFSISRALKLIQVPKQTYDKWRKTDPDFSLLVDELEWHKKNFIEGAALTLVADGNSFATVAINRAVNSDRGYSEKQQIDISGGLNVNHNLIDLDKIDLPIEIRKAILDAIRAQKGDVPE